MISTQCYNCKHYWGVFSCDAFPKGNIPAVIKTGLHDHTKPFKGDNGIRFEAWTDPADQADMTQTETEQ